MTVGNRDIVIVGGFNSGVVNGVFEFEYFNSTFWFDGTTYKRLPDMPFKRSNMALVATDDIVYAFGGGEMDPSYASCARLDLKQGTNALSRKRPVLQAVHLVSLVTVPAAPVHSPAEHSL